MPIFQQQPTPRSHGNRASNTATASGHTNKLFLNSYRLKAGRIDDD
jgi:hypothetical protein